MATPLAVRGDVLAARPSGATLDLREAMARYEHRDRDVQPHVRDKTQLTDLAFRDILIW